MNMKCSYCSAEVQKGRGIMYVYKIGNVAYYCSSKCYKNGIILKRKISKKNVMTGTKVQKQTPA